MGEKAIGGWGRACHVEDFRFLPHGEVLLRGSQIYLKSGLKDWNHRNGQFL
jgi:hypothetical protein